MMAAPASNEPAPPSAADRLANAQAACADTNRQIGDLTAQRNAALLASDDDATAIRLGSEIDVLREAARAHSDKIELLRDEVQREDQERRAKEREAAVARIEKKIAQRDKFMEEAAEAIKQLAKSSERAIKLNSEIVAAWSWPPHDLPPALLTPSAVMTAVAHECFRTSYHPRRYGGADVDPLAGISLPLSRAPTLQLMEDPARVRPMVDVVRDASEFARRFLRTGKGSAGVEHVSYQYGTSVMNGGGEPVQRSDAEQRLSKLLAQMAKAAEDVTPAGEQEYLRIMGEVQKAQAEVTAEQQVQHG
jgi:hypothetical protein